MTLDDRINDDNSRDADNLIKAIYDKNVIEKELRELERKRVEHHAEVDSALRDYRAHKRLGRYIGGALTAIGIAGFAMRYPDTEYIPMCSMILGSGMFFLWSGTHGKYL